MKLFDLPKTVSCPVTLGPLAGFFVGSEGVPNEGFTADHIQETEIGTETETETDKPDKIMRAEKAGVIATPAEKQIIEGFTALLNERIGFIVDTVKRWHEGRFGEVEGEDSALADKMREFAEVALEKIAAKHLVRVFSHLERGELFPSAHNLIVGQSRRDPKDGPLEKAIKKGDSAEVARMRQYVDVVRMCVDSTANFLPLSFLKSWRSEFQAAFYARYLDKLCTETGQGKTEKVMNTADKIAKQLGGKWVDLILDDAAQYLRHHAKLLLRWKDNEAAREKALAEFENSKQGKAYLRIRSQHFPSGLPRNRGKRLAVLSSSGVCQWQKKTIKLVEASSVKALLERNPELSALVKADIRYKTLTKPNTPPTWTQVSAKNRRLPFIPKELFGNFNTLSGGKINAVVDLPVGREARIGESSSATLSTVKVLPLDIILSCSGRLAASSVPSTQGEVSLPDRITGELGRWNSKGLRFVPTGTRWSSSISMEKIEAAVNPRFAKFEEALKDKAPAPVTVGDKIIVLVLEPQPKRKKGGNFQRAGWVQTWGITQKGASILDSRALEPGMGARLNRALRNGREPWWASDERKRSKSPAPKASMPEGKRAPKPSVHGQNRGVTLATILDRRVAVNAEIRLIRLLKDPERTDEAVEVLTSRIAAYRKRNKGEEAARLVKVLSTLENGKRPSHTQLEPFKTRLRTLRQGLEGLKRQFRKEMGTNALRYAHQVRLGQVTNEVSGFTERYGTRESVTLLLVERNKSGKGPGPYKPRALNRVMAAFGAAQIGESLKEHARFLTPAIDILEVDPKDIKKICPSCLHLNAANPSGNKFECGSDECGTKREAELVATFNLISRFLTPDGRSDLRAFQKINAIGVKDSATAIVTG